jgi:hypothetical protein
MREYLDQMWDAALTAFAAAVEDHEANHRKDKTDDSAGRHRGGP